MKFAPILQEITNYSKKIQANHRDQMMLGAYLYLEFCNMFIQSVDVSQLPDQKLKIERD